MKEEKSDNKENKDVTERSMVASENASTIMAPAPEKKISTIKNNKQDKIVLHEFENHVKEIRAQLAEQLRCVGERTETQIAVLGELEDFFKRRGELEAEYAKQLDKLAKNLIQRHKAEKNRRESWNQHTACTAWTQVVDDAKEEAQQRSSLAEFYQKVLVASINSRCDDLAKISKRCREIGALSHSEINRVLTELHTAMKTYQLCHSELVNVERKFRVVEDEKLRYEEANPGKGLQTRKYRSIVKYYNKREEKYDVVRTKCTKARNEYLMCIRAANAALHRFFAQDLSYLIDCMDLGMDFWMKSILEQLIDYRKRLAQREMDSLADLGTLRSSFDSKADKQRFFEAHNATFMLPKQFEFRPQAGDGVGFVAADKGLAIELSQRQTQIEKRLHGLRFESDEVWKSLEAAERQLHQLYSDNAEDMAKWRNDVLVTYQYYLKKFEHFLLNGNLIERLEARANTIEEALLRESGQVGRRESNCPASEERAKRKTRRIGVAADPAKPRPKLFGGSLDEYVEATGEAIPLVVTSSIGYLSRFSLRNQGLFRVSGSQSEINRFKDAYERGDDAFAELTDGSESNSVAGVLKLYLRELREPLFPIFMFDQFTECAKAESQDFVRRASELLCKLPTSHILLLRFLFGFLSHLCEFADENMMEPHNLAICFGPTLIPIPDGKDQVFFHNYVNELVRNLIVHWMDVFPADLGGPLYDKFAIDAEPEHVAYVDDNDPGSDEEEGLKTVVNGLSSSQEMLNSTYDMSVSTDTDLPRELTQVTLQASPQAIDTRQPSLSSRSSNRSTVDDYLRRMSEDVSPILRTDLPQRIANELNAKFAFREKENSAQPSYSRSVWEPERASSHASSVVSTVSAPPAPPATTTSRPPVMTSLRDQLHHFRRELNGRDDNNKVYPLSDAVPLSKNRFASSPRDDVILDARGGSSQSVGRHIAHRDRTEPMPVISGDLYKPLANFEPELKRGISEQQTISNRVHSTAPPDVVASTRRAKSEARNGSPPLDELLTALQATELD